MGNPLNILLVVAVLFFCFNVNSSASVSLIFIFDASDSSPSYVFFFIIISLIPTNLNGSQISETHRPTFVLLGLVPSFLLLGAYIKHIRRNP